MTKVRFFADSGVINGFEVSGHSTSGCDDELGKLVCAFVSSAAIMSANTVTEVIFDAAEVIVGEDNARIYLMVKNPKQSTKDVLEGFKLHMEQLAEQYANSIKVISEV